MNIIRNLFGGWDWREWLKKHVIAAVFTAMFTFLSRYVGPDEAKVIADLITKHLEDFAVLLVGLVTTIDWFTFRSFKKRSS